MDVSRQPALRPCTGMDCYYGRCLESLIGFTSSTIRLNATRTNTHKTSNLNIEEKMGKS
jgi:hypothetical protein